MTIVGRRCRSWILFEIYVKFRHRGNPERVSTLLLSVLRIVSKFLREMYEGRYYDIIRMSLKILGLWPYQQSFFVLTQKVLFTLILVTFVIAQVPTYIYTIISTYTIWLINCIYYTQILTFLCKSSSHPFSFSFYLFLSFIIIILHKLIIISIFFL